MKQQRKYLKSFIHVALIMVILVATFHFPATQRAKANTSYATTEAQFDNLVIQKYGKLTNSKGYSANWGIYSKGYHLIVFGDPSVVTGINNDSGASVCSFNQGSSVTRYLGKTYDNQNFENPCFPPDVNPPSGYTPDKWNYVNVTGASRSWQGIGASQKEQILNTNIVFDSKTYAFQLSSLGSDYLNLIKIQSKPSWFNDGSVITQNSGQGGKVYYANFVIPAIVSNPSAVLSATLTPQQPSYTMGPLEQTVSIPYMVTASVQLQGHAQASDIQALTASNGQDAGTTVAGQTTVTSHEVFVVKRSNTTPGTHTITLPGNAHLSTAFGDEKTINVSRTVTLTVAPDSGPPAITASASVTPSSIQFQNTDIPVTVNVSGLVSNVKDPNSIDHVDIYARFSSSSSYQKKTVSGGTFSPSASFSFTIPASSITSSPQPMPFTATVRAFFKAGAGLPDYINDSTEASTLVYQGSPPAPPSPPPTNPTNLPPVANINSPSSIEAGQDFYINANGSHDPDGTIQGYAWYLPGSSGSVSGTGGSLWYRWPGYVTSHTEGLTVTDDGGSSGSTSRSITVTAPRPKSVITYGGTRKQNRLLILDARKSITPTHYPLDASKTVWQLTPQSGCSSSDIKYSGSLSGILTKDILVKRPCTIQVTLSVTNTAGLSDTSTRTLEVAPDEPPVVKMDAPTQVFRDPSNGNKASFILTDESYSPDRDFIPTSEFHIAYDSNNDGSANGEVYVKLELQSMVPGQVMHFTLEGNAYTVTKRSKTQIQIESSQVGNTIITETVKEGYGQPTIAAYITAADARQSTAQITIDTINTAPVSSFTMSKPKKIDMIVSVGNSQYDTATVQSKVNADLLSKLRANNIDAHITVKPSHVPSPFIHDYFYQHDNGGNTGNDILYNYNTGQTIQFSGYNGEGFAAGSKIIYPVQGYDYSHHVNTYTYYVHDFLTNTTTNTHLVDGYFSVVADVSLSLDGTIYYVEEFNYTNQYGTSYVYHYLDRWDPVTEKSTRVTTLSSYSYYNWNQHRAQFHYDPLTNQYLVLTSNTSTSLSIYDLDTNTWQKGAGYSQYGVPGKLFVLQNGHIVFGTRGSNGYNYGVYVVDPTTGQTKDIVPPDAPNTDIYQDFTVIPGTNKVLISETNSVLTYDDTDGSMYLTNGFNDGKSYTFDYTLPDGMMYWNTDDGSGNLTFGSYNDRTGQKLSVTNPLPSPYTDLAGRPLKNWAGSVPIAMHQQIQGMTWRDGSDRYYVDIDDASIHELNNSAIRQADQLAFNDDQMQFIGLGTSVNQTQLTNFVSNLNLGGTYYDTDPSLDTALNELAASIITKENTQSTITNRVMLRRNPDGTYQPADITYQLFYNDYEKDPVNAQHWIFNQDPTVYENSMGMDAGAGQVTEAAPHQLDKVGKFTIYHQYQDNPKNDSRFANYWLWSDPALSSSVIYVHRQPVAEFTTDSTYNYTSHECTLTIQDYSYDPDHASQANRGIVQEIWKYRKVGDAVWTLGKPPTSADENTQYNIYLKVKDMDGGWSDPLIKEVTLNYEGTPVAHFTISPKIIGPQGNFTITDQTADYYGNKPAYEQWYIYKGTQLLGEQSAIPTADTLRYDDEQKNLSVLGIYKIGVEARNNSGGWSNMYYDTLTIENHAPVPNFTLPASVFRDASFTLNNSTADPDGDAVTYKWTAMNGSYSHVFSTAASPTFNFNSLGLGAAAVSKNWMIQLTATDANGASASIAEPIHVVDQKPIASASGPNNGYEGSPYTFTSSDSDSDPGDTLMYTWIVVSPSGVKTKYATQNIARTFDEKGDWSIQHYATDELGTQSNIVTLTLDILNQLPLASFTVTPTTKGRTQPITVTSTATDSDGYVNSYDYYVTPPGQSEYLYAHNRDWTWTGLNMIGTWAIRQHVTDNNGGGDTTDVVHTVNVVDQPPSVTLTTPSGPDISHPSGNEPPFTARWTYSDPDGDPQATYDVIIYNASTGTQVWDSGVLNGSNSSMAISATLTGGSTYDITITVTDGRGQSATSSPKYFVTNRPPVARFSWSPQPVWEGDTVTMQNQSTDPDIGNTLTFAWTITDPSGTVTHSTLTNPSLVASPGTYQIQLITTDNFGASDTVSHAIIVTAVTVDGFVNHTSLWNQHRITYNQSKTRTDNSPRGYNVFFSGEMFVLHADTTGDIQQVSAQIVNPSFSTYLNLTSNSGTSQAWDGSLWDKSMLKWKSQNLTYRFTLTTTSGYQKSVDVPILINADPYWRPKLSH